MSAAGVDKFIVHARKALLNGLSPEQNRTIPPLRYPVVYQLAQDFPGLELIINGGITSVKNIKQHMSHVNGVMIGRQAWNTPYLFAEIEEEIFNNPRVPSRTEVFDLYLGMTPTLPVLSSASLTSLL